jgi:hypothetical protein
MKRRLVSWIVATATSMILLVPLSACEDDPSGFQGIPPIGQLEAGLLDVNPGRFDGNVPPGLVEAGLIDVSSPKPDTGTDAAPEAAGPGCGNAVIDPGETCDPLASCPTACAPIGCQLRALEKGGTCQAACVNTTMQTACANGDGCCPTGCNVTNDSDCTAACGNGVVETGETCDTTATGAGACPATCPAAGCSLRTLQGAGTCTAACVETGTQTACVNGDGCCPAGCNTTNDSDCTTPGCGNNAVEAGETCDPLASCPQSCPPIGCQLRTLQGAGTCQAACVNTTMQTACANNDGCCPSGCNANNDNDCRVVCGNGTVEPGETCDTVASCPTSCPQQGCQLYTLANALTCQAACVASVEQTACVHADGCCPLGCNAANDSDCQAACGNGVLEPGETCDSAIPAGTAGACPNASTCATAGCMVRAIANPGTCQATCGVAETTTCASGDGCCPASGACNNTTDSDCRAVCGNGVVESGETCDTASTAGCAACPAASPPTRYTCYGTGVGTCQQDCNAPVLTCGPSADGCCPFGTNGACGTAADTDCAGAGWTSVRVGNVDTTQGCQRIAITAETNGSYDLTTCGPNKNSVGTGNPNITTVVAYSSGQTNAITAIGRPTNLQVHNDNCSDPNALPNLAGWYCKNTAGAVNVQACASPSPGGFKAPSPQLAMEVCASGTVPNPDYPACLDTNRICPERLPDSGVTPLYIWYNAATAPTACVMDDSACANGGTLGCCAGSSCTTDTGVACSASGAGCTCKPTTTCVATGDPCSVGGYGCCESSPTNTIVCRNGNGAVCQTGQSCTCSTAPVF